jgi:hypothetical protein
MASDWDALARNGPPVGSKDEAVLHHTALRRIVRALAPGADLADYWAHGVEPNMIYRSKRDHLVAVDLLVRALDGAVASVPKVRVH